MEDTGREVRDLQRVLWMSLSEEERFRRCGRLFALAKQFAEARAPKGADAEETKRFVFREFYGFDMPQITDRQA